MKKIVLVFISCLFLGNIFTTKVSACDVCDYRDACEKFTAHERGGYYLKKFKGKNAEGQVEINFSKPAMKFTLLLIDENGVIKLKSEFTKYNDGKGVNRLVVGFQVKEGKEYSFKLVNEDSARIGGNVEISY